MGQDRNDRPLDPRLRDRVLERFGLAAAPHADLAGLVALYAAWCANVPFDNLRKMTALRRGDAALPGTDAGEFLERWLADGTGGTCWTTSNALHALARALGFDAERLAGWMHDRGVVNHGSVAVRIDARRWLVDTSLLHGVPAPLGGEVFVSSDPVFTLEVEPADEGRHLVWTELPPIPGHLACRLLAGSVSHAFCVERYEASRARSPFNERLYARRNLPGELLVLRGPVRIARTAAGESRQTLTRAQTLESLHEEFGFSGAAIDAWVGCGALDASMQPVEDTLAQPATGVPPSRRGAR